MKKFKEIWAEVAEDNLKEILSYNIKRYDTHQKEAKEDIMKAREYYDQLYEQILHGGSLVYIDTPAWTIFDYNHFKLNKDDDFNPGHDNFNTVEFLDAYGFEDHYFYLAWIKGYETSMKIKMHIDPSSSIEIVSTTPYKSDTGNTIYCWDWPEKFLAFMPLPDLPEH